MYEIIFSDIARKELKKLDRDIQKRIINTLERIRIRPYSFVKKVVGGSSFRLRVGKYRIIMDILKDKLLIFVIEVEKRSKVYLK